MARLEPTIDVVAIKMTKRELFAGLAMAGYIANPKLTDPETDDVTAWSIEVADALLAKLAKEPDDGG